mgnify:CR=1 FL=1
MVKCRFELSFLTSFCAFHHSLLLSVIPFPCLRPLLLLTSNLPFWPSLLCLFPSPLSILIPCFVLFDPCLPSFLSVMCCFPFLIPSFFHFFFLPFHLFFHTFFLSFFPSFLLFFFLSFFPYFLNYLPFFLPSIHTYKPKIKK